MTAFDRAWDLVKEEIGVKGTPCPQCGAQYDPDEDEWTATVGYSTMFKQPYICHDCDINWDGPSGGEREEDESARQNWQIGHTKIGGEEFDFTVAPVQQRGSKKEMLEGMGAFMQDRVVPALDEAKRAFLEVYLQNYSYDSPHNTRKKQGITNAIMPMSLDDFTMEMERKVATKDQYDAQFPPASSMRQAGKAALDILNRMGGMDEGMA